jgi:hypothetical protein
VTEGARRTPPSVRLPSFLTVLTLLVFFCAVDPAHAALRWHGFVVLNQGNVPIFEMHLAKPVRFGQETWGPDLLSFSRVIDVDEGREFKMKLDSQNCVYDVRAIYQDGHDIVLHGVNLCKTDRVSFNY